MLFRLIPIFVSVLVFAGCAKSRVLPVDAGVDAGDGSISFEAGMMMEEEEMPECGNGKVEAGEQCDDNNLESEDGCSSNCEWEAYCGDGEAQGDEVCDDGNNRSGDGCRADCVSDESCGNDIRDVAAGELCDDGNMMDGDGCSADCSDFESCGDGDVDPGEQCDDNNTTAYDGCGVDCYEELAFVINSLEVAGAGEGCDYSGDGNPDNAFGTALGFARGLINDMFISAAVEGGDLLLLMDMLALEDLEAKDDSNVTVAFSQGIDADNSNANNFGGSGKFRYPAAVLNANGKPKTSFASSINNRNLSGGPEDVVLPIAGLFEFELQRSQLLGSTTSDAGRMSGVEDGYLCGGLPTQVLSESFDLSMLIGMGMLPFDLSFEPCDGSDDPPSFLDLIVGGISILFINLDGVQPDVDLDADGVERFEVDSDGAFGCQPVITACIDGDGTRVEGRDCANSDEISMRDAFSIALGFTAVPAEIIGVQ